MNSSQRLAAVLAAVYGLVALIGGLIGFIKAGSVASLVAGGGSGLLLLVSAALVPRKSKVGLGLALVVSLLLLGRFASTAIASGAPNAIAMVMIVGGLAVAVASARALFTRSG